MQTRRNNGIVSSLLDGINSPADLKALERDELSTVVQELRERMIDTVSRTGGHLAASLGAIELAVAMHYVLEAPSDKIVWDVGHQAYAHKLLTGRREQFETLRRKGGISGFPRRLESPYDTFDTGHGSTAIAAAIGMAKARDLLGQENAVVAVVGDGAMTGGMAFEALNLAGHLSTPLIVVLNDNQMSISRNVGALAGYLRKVRLDPHYLRAKAEFESVLSRVPGGESIIDAVGRLKDGVKQVLMPGMLFEELGFTYLGPIDGHDLSAVIDTLEHARDLERPVLVHCVTQKGRGYVPAENDAAKWHRTGAFDVDTGEPVSVSSGLSFTHTFGEQMVRAADLDERVVAITAAMKAGTGLSEFAERFPDRFFDVGMAEQTAVTFGAGLAAEGLRPVVAIYSTFLQRAYDQIVHDVALQKLPVTLALDRGGVVGEDGPTHHGVFDLSFLRHIPNLVVMAPKDLSELAAMLRTALELDAPAAIRYPRGEGTNPPDGDQKALPVGRAELLREGNEVAILAIGTMVGPAEAAAARLAEKGIGAAVLNARFVKPLDEDVICELATSCGRVVTVEENAVSGGFGSAVMEMLERRGISVPVLPLGIPDRFVEHGSRDELLADLGLEPEAVATAVAEFVTTVVAGPAS
ncbi:MAG: 1-deoxy-D-xylulose-5-phosphate synthase [Armatimonadetes bacterium]|nr:1-deoxy-D-xylulose-5-phosphate synthase [Armatimonadota bacterium]